MKSQYILFCFFSVFLSHCAFGQDFLPAPEGQHTVAQLQTDFLHWADGKDLTNVHGWKWYGRWLEEQIQNSTSKGHWPDQSALFAAATQLAEYKAENTARRESNWLPVGPNVFPVIPGNRLIRGMGRINTVEFHPTDPNTLWVGVAQGGVWKSTDAGAHWRPLTDNLPILRISDIEVDPNNTEVMYISVGDYAYLGAALDTDARKRNTHYGLGVYKSIDGGETWNPTGLVYNQIEKDASLIRRVFVSPTNSDRLIAAGIQGVFISTDGGDTWDKKLDEVMADIERDPSDENIFYAASQRVEKTGIGRSTIWKSIDGGDTWLELNSGIVSTQARRIELAVAPSNTNVIYALVCNTSGGLFGFYKSEDAGATWVLKITQPNILHWYSGGSDGGQGTYDLALMIDPDDSDRVYTGGVNMWGTEDGGNSWKRASFWLPDYGPSLHADHHQYRYNPVDGYYYACHDGGINRTQQIDLFTQDEVNSPGFEFTTQWEDISAGMEISSFYRMDVSRIHTGDVIAGAQDNSTYIKVDTQWLNVVLGDGMDCMFHPTDGNIVYTSSQNGRFVRSDNRGSNFSSSLTFSINETGGWTTPFEQDPFNPDGIYAAFGNVWKSDFRGENWIKLTDFPSIPNSDFILPASTLSVSPSDPNRFYVAKRIYPTVEVKGEMWTSPDGGVTINNISNGLPDSIYITASAVSDINPSLVWVSLAGFEDGLKIFRSDDAGENWLNISNNLPNVPVNAVEFSSRSESNMIYIGTDIGVYYKNDDMLDWELYSDGLPNVIVTDLVIDTDDEMLYASTFGRGIWKSDLAVISSAEDVSKVTLDIDLHPNPNQGAFKLSFTDFGDGEIALNIWDVKGRLVHHEDFMVLGMVDQKSFKLALNNGLYFAQVSGDEISKIIKFVVE